MYIWLVCIWLYGIKCNIWSRGWFVDHPKASAPFLYLNSALRYHSCIHPREHNKEYCEENPSLGLFFHIRTKKNIKNKPHAHLRLHSHQYASQCRHPVPLIVYQHRSILWALKCMCNAFAEVLHLSPQVRVELHFLRNQYNIRLVGLTTRRQFEIFGVYQPMRTFICNG